MWERVARDYFYSKIGLTASYLNYLPAPCLPSKAAVLRAFSLVALAIRRRVKRRDRKYTV